MARKLLLDTLDYINHQTAVNERFSYGEMMLIILRQGIDGSGLSLDEVVSSLDAMRPIETAIAQDRNEVTLSDAQWSTLLNKVNRFRFSMAHQIVADFGLHIRNAPKIDGEEPAR
jgi:hypothetical protein